MIKQGYAGRASQALLAGVLAAGLMLPATSAFAKSSDNDVADASFTLTGITSGDVVHAYQVFDTDIDANNNLTNTLKVSGLPADYDTVEEIYAATNARAMADAIAAQVIATSETTTQATASDNKATLTLDSGYWLVTVTSNSGDTKVTAKFTISGTVPSYPADATYAIYSITDVPDAGLAVDTTSFVVKSGGNTLAEGADYTLTANADGTYTVAFSQAFVLAHPGQAVTIDYDAVVTKIDLITGKVGNKVYGTFAPNPYENKDSDTTPTDPWDQTYGFEFKKVGAPDNNALAGAEFTVTDKDGNAVTYIDASGNLHTDGKVTSDDNGWVYVNGLEKGTYTVTETIVPSGFQKIDPFTVELNGDTAKFDASSTAGITEENFSNQGEKVDPKVGELPTTGGAGTIALTAGGILLVVGGSAVVYRSRRKSMN